ncbi:MAG: uroporphyrinogen-III synthase [Halioglobus sp.]
MAAKPAVLVTRPEGQAAALCAGLEKRGFQAFSQPMLELVACEQLTQPQQRHIAELDLYQHIIFISGNAVQFGMAWMHKTWPTLPGSPAWYAIGGATARRLGEYGVQLVSSSAGMSSESLLEHSDLQAVAGQRVLIVKGHGGRVSLQQELGRRGARVDELACYRRQCPSLGTGALAQKLSQWQIGLVLVSSGEGLQNMMTLLGSEDGARVLNMPLIVPSARVASQARDLGFLTVDSAENASDAAVLQAVENRWQISNKALESSE